MIRQNLVISLRFVTPAIVSFICPVDMTEHPSVEPDAAPEEQSQRKRRWVRRVRILLLVAVALCAASVCFEQYQRHLARNLHQPPGKLVDVDGRIVHVVDVGTGTPTVVFESGLGSAGSQAWCLVQPAVAKYTRTISYDRNGYLWSDPAETTRDSETISRELLETLRAIEAPPPYMLVGHSMGGIHMRVFAHKYPDLVAGLVLVDSSHPDQESVLPREMVLEPPAWQLYGFQAIANLGVFRFMDVLNYSDEQSAEQRQVAFDFFPTHAATIAAEIRAQADNFRQAANTSFGDLPIRIVTAGQHHPKWHELQADFKSLSTNARQVIAWRSGHRIPWEEPAVITSQIKELIHRP
jgi:pimeloyl-ACP methyl ester carboxylesterase